MRGAVAYEREPMTSFDAIIVGGGGSGLAAAVSAAQRGLRVCLLEKRRSLGGTTGMAVGSFTANRTAYQRRAGVEDRLEWHVEDAGKFAVPEIEARNNRRLRRWFLAQTAETLDWLTRLGLSFHGPSPEGPNRVPRMHNVVPNAQAYIAALQVAFLRLGGDIRCDSPVESLLMEAGAVTGVRVRRAGEVQTLRARLGVVLAAGDYANSRELIAQYKGERFACVEGIDLHATGDGHRLARQAGAALVNMDVTYGPELRFIAPRRKTLPEMLPSRGFVARAVARVVPYVPGVLMRAVIRRLLVTWQHPENALFDDGAVLINRRGERFCNEKAWPDRELAVARQPDKQAYILLDTRLMELYSRWPHFISTAPQIAYAYVKDYLRLRPDVAVEASTIEGVCAARQLPAESVRESIAAYNRYVRGEGRDPFGRAGDAHVLQEGRCCLLGPMKAYFTTTEGGAAINEQLQVLDEAGHVVQGLYAVGQTGLGGQVLWGHGLHIAWAITSGRLVGAILAGNRPPDADTRSG